MVHWLSATTWRSEEHTSELQSQFHLVCRLLLEKKKHLEFLNHIRVVKGNVVVLSHVVVGSTYPFNQVVVVIFALAIDEHLGGAAAELRGGIQFAVSACAQGEELLVVLRGEREVPHGLLANGLARRSVGGVNGSHLRGDFDLFGDGAGLQGNTEA